MNLNATILGQAIAFFLFVIFCMKYVWPPLIEAIEKRQKEIADSIASAERAKKDLDLAQANMTEQLQKAKEQAQVIIEQANKRKVQILENAKVEAEQERKKIIMQAQAEIDADRKRAYEELRKQITGLAIAGAERIINCSVNETINRTLVDTMVAELEQ